MINSSPRPKSFIYKCKYVFSLIEWPAILFFKHQPKGLCLRRGHSTGSGGGGHCIFYIFFIFF
ncbi:unnamed protein product [Meloidogyne enterolobii]|uniref:Uncharacterized protein n=1 Tax=Meloidogyne enterolobii TaxID=390850 RepID=A0ACB1B5U2_MELEN